MKTVIFKGKKAHFKKYGTLTSVEGKSNKAGIRFKENDYIGMDSYSCHHSEK